MVTWPSAISTTLLSLRTHKTVVPCICALSSLFCIRPLYNWCGLRPRWRQARPRERVEARRGGRAEPFESPGSVVAATRERGQLSSSFSFFFSSLDLWLPTFWKRWSSEDLLKRSAGRFELYLQLAKKTWLERRPLRSWAICIAVRTPSISWKFV